VIIVRHRASDDPPSVEIARFAIVRRLLTDTVYPPLCPISGMETGVPGTLSPEAWREMSFLLGGPRCERCGRSVPGVQADLPGLACDACTGADWPWSRGRAAFFYEGSGRRLVLSLKHGDRLDLVPLIAGWMLQAGPDLVATADLIVPVPLHWRRLVMRRYNQSGELARRTARLAGKPAAYAPRLLRRIRATPVQDGRDREGRIANLANAIAPAPGAARRLAGRRVLLIDDVMTTGATLSACSRAVLSAGAGGVDVLVAALVPFGGMAYVPPDTEHEETPA